MSTREKLKNIAMDVVQDKGIRALTLRDLGEAAGIKSSSVAYHFGSKEALVREITSDYIERIQDAVRNAESTLEPGMDRMLALFDQFERLGKAGRLCLGGVIAGSLHDVDEQTAALVRRFFANLEKWFTAQIQAAAPAGMDRKLAGQRARALVSSAQGALLLDKTDGKTTHLRAVRQSIAALAQT